MGMCYGRCCCSRTKRVISDVGAGKLSYNLDPAQKFSFIRDDLYIVPA